MKKNLFIFAFALMIVSVAICGFSISYAIGVVPETTINGSTYYQHYNYAPNNDYSHVIEICPDANDQLDDSYFTYKKITDGAKKSATTRIETYNSVSEAYTYAYIKNKSGTVVKYDSSTITDVSSNGFDTVSCYIVVTINNPLVFNFQKTQHNAKIVFWDSDGDISDPDIDCEVTYYE